MSRGPGIIEQRIAALFAATRDRPLDIRDIARRAFETQNPTRAQRLSATRATHRLLRRVREWDERAKALVSEAHASVKATLGRERSTGGDEEYGALLDGSPALKAARALFDAAERIGRWTRVVRDQRPGSYKGETDFWCTTTLKGRLVFHPPDVPVQVWAVAMDRSGVHWFEAAVTRITARNVMVSYRGERARLDRERLWRWSAFYRGVLFVSSQSGRIAARLEKIWSRRFGGPGSVPPSMQMPLEQARLMLGLPEDYGRGDVVVAFRGKAKEAHPDVGGTAEMFRVLVEARDRLLSALGTSAPPPKPPSYAPSGTVIRYRRSSGATPRRLGSMTPRLCGA